MNLIDILKHMKINRINLKVSLPNGEFWITGFNGTFEDAQSYYLGQRFEALNPYTGLEYMQEPVCKVEMI